MGGRRKLGSIAAHAGRVRPGGVQGQGNAAAWREFRDAALRYADTDTSLAGDAAFLRHRVALAMAAIRWVVMLPPDAPVLVLGGLHGFRWRLVARSALSLAAAIEEAGTSSVLVSSLVRLACDRLRGNACLWVRDGGCRFDAFGRGALRVGGAA